MSDKDRKSQDGDIIENVIVDGFIHQEFVIGVAATPLPNPPADAKVMVWHNDSGEMIRYGGPDVTYGAADVTRGIPVLDGKGFSVGVMDGRAKNIFFIALGAARKTIIAWGV